ncbi:MAG: hypothetical protein MHMPM18_001614 [Marteilia pararefringens]
MAAAASLCQSTSSLAAASSSRSLIVKLPCGSSSVAISLHNISTVKDLSAFLEKKIDCSSEQRIYFDYNGTVLDEDLNLATLPNLASINVQIELCGGKAHGQLTKAGKVRSNTPKVPKQAKVHKTLCKRARFRVIFKKREQAKLAKTRKGGRR